MRWHRLIAAAAVAISAPLAAQEPAVSDNQIAAIAMPEEQLREFLLRAVASTQTFKMSFVALGLDGGCKVWRPAFQKAVDDHLPQWRTNLISAYRQNVPSEVLRAAVEEDPKSAFVQLMPHLDAISADMQQASTPVLQKASTEVMGELWEAASEIDMETVDLEERKAELSGINSKTFCAVSAETSNANSREETL